MRGLIMLVLLSSQSALAEREKEPFEFSSIKLGNLKVEYYLHRAPCQTEPCKVLLALPPGGQTRAMVREGLERWIDDFKRDGWTIISPVATREGLYMNGGRKRVVELLDAISKHHRLSSGKAFLFGISNGGISALEVAAHAPDRFHSVTVLPGVLRSKPALLKNSTVNIMVGSKDGSWTRQGKTLVRKLNKLGANAKLEIIEGAGHYAFQQVSFRKLRKCLLRGTILEQSQNSTF